LRLIKSIAAAKADENDIVLVLDSSGSIGNSDWQKMLQACETLLTTMSSKPIRVAVVVFACTASIICQWTADYVSVMATLYGTQGATHEASSVSPADLSLDSSAQAIDRRHQHSRWPPESSRAVHHWIGGEARPLGVSVHGWLHQQSPSPCCHGAPTVPSALHDWEEWSW